MRAKVFVALALTVMTASAAYAQARTNAEIIAARKSQFMEIGAAFKQINDQLRQDVPIKIVVTRASTKVVNNLSQVGANFPVGSARATGVKTNALPIIWSERARFDQLLGAAVQSSRQLQALLQSGDFVGARNQVRVVGRSCAACHDRYRVKE
ncbi:cytochrome c [Novosphingobium sp. G106]|uniref:c-type cytochrome n=1 Tax=Novosphingobium sp. G106 TaxID=2849500 RepID=UPI001C2CEB8C|nr:cytochrome c [Novosphingobium sp. G106]